MAQLVVRVDAVAPPGHARNLGAVEVSEHRDEFARRRGEIDAAGFVSLRFLHFFLPFPVRGSNEPRLALLEIDTTPVIASCRADS